MNLLRIRKAKRLISSLPYSRFLCGALLLSGITSLPAQSDLPGQRIGVEGPGLELTLPEAVRLALENNPSIRVSRQEVQARRQVLASRKGVFDPYLEVNSLVRSDTLPVGSVLAGGESGKVSTDRWTSSVGVRQGLPFGGDWSAVFQADRSTTSSVFTQLDPQYPTFLGVNLNLPLLRDRSIDLRRLQIRVAARDIEVGQAELRQIVLDLVTRVRIHYWNLALAREDQGVRAEAVRLARQQLERNRRLLEAGQASGVDVVEAEALWQKRQEEWLASFEQITARENDLKREILGGRSEPLWRRELVPVDRDETVDSVMSVAQAWELAATRRPELMRLTALARVQEANSNFLSDQTKPTLDLVASYGMSGLAGQLRGGGNPFSSQNTIFFERINSLSGLHSLEAIPIPVTGGVPERLQGNLGQSLSNLFSGDFRTGSVGVRLDLPFGNHQVKGELAASRIRERQLELQRVATEQQIESEIRNALQAVATSRQRIQAAVAARTAARARLDSEQRLFEAGETTNFLLLSRQTAFIEASASEVRAGIDLNIALANLQRVLGVALESFGIRLEE